MPPAVAVVGAVQPIAAIVQQNPPGYKNVILPALHPIVVKTAFLTYDAAPAVAGVARVSLANSQMLRAFGRRCQLSQAPALAPLTPPGILQLAIGTQGWTKVLQELVASGLLNLTFANLDGLDKAIDSLTITTPANLVLTRADLDLGEDTTAIAAVAGVAARPAAGRRGSVGYAPARPAVAAVAGRPPLDVTLEFLSTNYVTVPNLEIAGVAPWANIAYLCGTLGPCLTQTARNGIGSARLSAPALAMGMNKAFGISLADNLSLAGELPNFLSILRTRLPGAFRCDSVDNNLLRVEFRDTTT